MPRLRSRFTGARGTGERRKTIWVGAVDNGTFTGIGANGVLAFSSLNAAALALRPFTIIRVRGLFSVKGDQLTATESGSMAIGTAVVSSQAVAIGVTALPTPITDGSSDLWLQYQFGHWATGVSSAIGIVEPQIMSYVIDSKAMRKVEDGMDVVVTAENESGTAGVQFKFQTRLLLKLH